MNFVQFLTRIRHLCRMRAQLNCSYVFYTSIGTSSVVVSASDWHAGGPGLILRSSKPVIFGIRTNRPRLTVSNCAAGGAMLCATYTGMPRT